MKQTCCILIVILSICAAPPLMCMQVEQHSDPEVIVQKLIALSPAEFEALSQDVKQIELLEDLLSKYPHVVERILRTHLHSAQ